MSGPMSGPALDPRLKSWQSVSVPKSVDETQPPEKQLGAGSVALIRRIMTFYARCPGYM